MLRRFVPGLLILISFVLDTTIIPMVYGGVLAVPVTFIVVALTGILLGRMRGLLYGTLGGLLLDITTGTLGMMTFYFMAAGFMLGLILYNPAAKSLKARRSVRRQMIWRASWIFVFYTLGEIVLLIYQYFYTATLHWVYFGHILARGLICTALTMLLTPAMRAIMVGRRRSRVLRAQEVKTF